MPLTYCQLDVLKPLIIHKSMLTRRTNTIISTTEYIIHHWLMCMRHQRVEPQDSGVFGWPTWPMKILQGPTYYVRTCSNNNTGMRCNASKSPATRCPIIHLRFKSASYVPFGPARPEPSSDILSRHKPVRHGLSLNCRALAPWIMSGLHTHSSGFDVFERLRITLSGW